MISKLCLFLWREDCAPTNNIQWGTKKLILKLVFFAYIFGSTCKKIFTSICIYLHPCLKSFQINFKIRSQNQLIFAKTIFARKKLAIGKDAPFWKIQKLFFIDLRFRNWNYSDSQKHESSCLLSDCFSCISPEPLELKKVIFIYGICILVWTNLCVYKFNS